VFLSSETSGDSKGFKTEAKFYVTLALDIKVPDIKRSPEIPKDTQNTKHIDVRRHTFCRRGPECLICSDTGSCAHLVKESRNAVRASSSHVRLHDALAWLQSQTHLLAPSGACWVTWITGTWSFCHGNKARDHCTVLVYWAYPEVLRTIAQKWWQLTLKCVDMNNLLRSAFLPGTGKAIGCPNP
jgi:hypothetical protein